MPIDGLKMYTVNKLSRKIATIAWDRSGSAHCLTPEDILKTSSHKSKCYYDYTRHKCIPYCLFLLFFFCQYKNPPAAITPLIHSGYVCVLLIVPLFLHLNRSWWAVVLAITAEAHTHALSPSEHCTIMFNTVWLAQPAPMTSDILGGG